MIYRIFRPIVADRKQGDLERQFRVEREDLRFIRFLFQQRNREVQRNWRGAKRSTKISIICASNQGRVWLRGLPWMTATKKMAVYK